MVTDFDSDVSPDRFLPESDPVTLKTTKGDFVPVKGVSKRPVSSLVSADDKWTSPLPSLPTVGGVETPMSERITVKGQSGARRGRGVSPSRPCPDWSGGTGVVVVGWSERTVDGGDETHRRRVRVLHTSNLHFKGPGSSNVRVLLGPR